MSPDVPPKHGVPQMLTVAAAKAAIGSVEPSVPAVEIVPLRRAVGRVLAEDVRAAVDVPPFRRAAMDGYAVRREDVASASHNFPARLRVDGSLTAGARAPGGASRDDGLPVAPLRPGCARRIATGAMLPPGAEGVVPVESTRPAGEGWIEVIASIERRSNVSERGEEFAAGEVAVCAGVRLGPEAVGAIASVGVGAVSVFAKPKVAVVTTGNELKRPGEALYPGEIYNSGYYALCGLIERDGGEVLGDGAPVPDAPREIRRAIESAAGMGADLVITTGGVSVGEKDCVPEAIEALGGRLLFWRVRMRPGKACAFAVLPGGPCVFALSGNPAAALVAYEVLARPFLLRLGGEAAVERQVAQAELSDGFDKPSPQERYLRAQVVASGGRLVASLAAGQQAGHFRSWMETNALVVVPAGAGPLPAGAKVDAMLLGALA